MTAAIIRADGSVDIGHGHIFRTLVLAQALVELGWDVHYCCRDLPGAPLGRVRDAGHALHLLSATLDEAVDAASISDTARAIGATVVVVDRYATESNAYAAWRAAGLRVAAIDDLAEHPFPVDVLINQNSNAAALGYVTDPDTVRLLGPRYALVRPVYREHRPAQAPRVDTVGRVLVFMGGADRDDATSRVLRALLAVSDTVEITVVIGAAYPHGDALAAVAQSAQPRVRIVRDAAHLAELMSWADLAISAGGSVVWELSCLGVPTLIAPIADNQVDVAVDLQARGAARYLGPMASLDDPALEGALSAALGDPARLAQLASGAYTLVDGAGAERVARHLVDL